MERPIPTAQLSRQLKPRPGKPNATISVQDSLFVRGGAKPPVVKTRVQRVGGKGHDYRHRRDRRRAVDERARPQARRHRGDAHGRCRDRTLITDWLKPGRVLPADKRDLLRDLLGAREMPVPSAIRSLARRSLRASPHGARARARDASSKRPSTSSSSHSQPLVRSGSSSNRTTSSQVFDAPAVLNQLVSRLTRPLLFVPRPIIPPPDDATSAVRLSSPQ